LDGLIRNWTATGQHYQYYPLVLTSFWVDYHLWGLDPAGYHIVNIALHGLNSVLLWHLLRRLGVPWAWLAAAVFGLHPVHVESVAWITERKNVLSLFFYLLAALGYARFVELERDNGIQRARPAWGAYVLSLLCFTLALLSKTVVCSFPAAVLLVTYWKRGRVGLHDVARLVPFFILGLGMGLFTSWVETNQIHAQGEEWSLTVVQRCLIAGRALWFYAAKLSMPVDLMFFYPRWEVSAVVWWQHLYPLVAVAVLGALWWWRERIGRGPLVAVLFFCGTLSPALGFFNVYPMRYSFVADHFQYHASIGLIIIGCAGICRFCSWTGQHARRAGVATSLLLLMALGVLTWRQGRSYGDLETLWADTLGKNPSAWMAESLLAEHLDEQGRTEEALEHDRRALALRPTDPELKYNVGGMLGKLGRYDEAVALLREVVVQRPNLSDAHATLGLILRELGRREESDEHLRRATDGR
jgi:protein O-mannosyl-transferase